MAKKKIDYTVFKQYSMAYAGVVITLVMMISGLLGWDLDEGQVTETVRATIEMIGAMMALYGTARRKDLNWDGTRK